MSEEHAFHATVAWPADPAQAKPPAQDYSRANTMAVAGRAPLAGPSPAALGGDDARYNPEELLPLSLSECHMLTYLALAARKGIAVLAYEDRATGVLGRGPAGRMQMTKVTLRPKVTVAAGTDLAEVRAMHGKAHVHCFMANSVNFPVEHLDEAAHA